MSELASMKKRLAACERKIADLEAQKRQSDFEIKAVRAQSEQRGNALRDLVARFCPLDNDIQMAGPVELQVRRADDDMNESDVDNADMEEDNVSNTHLQSQVGRVSGRLHRRNNHENNETDKNKLPPFRQNEMVTPFQCTEHAKLIRCAKFYDEMTEGDLAGAIDFSFGAMKATWPNLEIEPYNRLQLHPGQQPSAPSRPGAPGLVYMPSWIKNTAEEGLIHVVVKRGRNRWMFCGIYRAELLDGFELKLWKREACETIESWARYFAEKVRTKDQLACARFRLALEDKEEPSRTRCEEACSRSKYPRPSADEILRTWESGRALPLVYLLTCVGWHKEFVDTVAMNEPDGSMMDSDEDT